MVVGPFTPGFVADTDLAPQLAEIGIILLMFGVGVHFSWRDLLSMRRVAVPGAIIHRLVVTALAVAVTRLWGWDLTAGLVMGFALSVASTVVLLRALLDRNLLDSTQGRLAVAWLIVEDLFTVLALVFFPLLASDAPATNRELLATLGFALGKLVLLGAATVVIGMRAVPWLLIQASRTGSRELFTLAVLAVAFGVAFGTATLFGVSMALGAFLAGMVMGESDLSHRAAEEALPMRDAFAVLFFISVGMLFDPGLLMERPVELLMIVLLIVLVKPLAAFALVRLLGHPTRTALVVGAGLGQIGEFSFILAELGRSLDLIPEEGRSLIIAAAIISITLNPGMFRAIDWIAAWLRGRRAAEPGLVRVASEPAPEDHLGGQHHVLLDHAILCGFGRVGRLVAAALEQAGVPYLVVERDRGIVEKLRERGGMALHGDAAEHATQGRLGLADARLLVLAIPDPIATRQIAETARRLNPGLPIVARTQSEEEWLHLSDGRVDEALLGEHELARAMARVAVERLGARSDGTSPVGSSGAA